MAAGYGTRLRPLTEHTPKPLLPVQGKPLISQLIEALAAADITEISVNLHYLGGQIEQALGDGSQFGAKLRFAEEASLLETGGAIVAALPWLGEAPFLVVNADIYTDFDFRTLPTDLGSDLAHLVLTPTPSWREHGDFDYRDGRVTQRGGSHVYCSIGVLSPQMFADAPQTAFSWRDLMFKAVQDGLVGAQEHKGLWYDIGTLEQYQSVR